MKCPACNNSLLEKNASGMTLDVCYGGCGGIWFDAHEVEHVSARAAAPFHAVWQIPVGSVNLAEPRMCPRCPNQVLEREWFSDRKRVEIDQCPNCHGMWLDAGDFRRVYEELQEQKIIPAGWASALAGAARQFGGKQPA